MLNPNTVQTSQINSLLISCFFTYSTLKKTADTGRQLSLKIIFGIFLVCIRIHNNNTAVAGDKAGLTFGINAYPAAEFLIVNHPVMTSGNAFLFGLDRHTGEYRMGKAGKIFSLDAVLEFKVDFLAALIAATLDSSLSVFGSPDDLFTHSRPPPQVVP